MLSVTAFSQWETGQYKKTNQPYKLQEVDGLFYNQHEINSCDYVVEKDIVNNVWVISIYPFKGDQKEEWKEGTYQDVSIVKPSGERVTLEALCIDGMVYFLDDSFVKFNEAISNKGEYDVSMSHKIDQNKINYVFKFNN